LADELRDLAEVTILRLKGLFNTLEALVLLLPNHDDPSQTCPNRLVFVSPKRRTLFLE